MTGSLTNLQCILHSQPSVSVGFPSSDSTNCGSKIFFGWREVTLLLMCYKPMMVVSELDIHRFFVVVVFIT